MKVFRVKEDSWCW